MAKQTYRVRNWKDYNQALISRGSLTLYISEELLSQWSPHQKTGKKGRPVAYTDYAILCALQLKACFSLDYRRTQGLLQSIFDLMKLNLKAPHYTLMCKRQGDLYSQLKLDRIAKLKAICLLVDTTGLKIFGEGEWKTRQHNVEKRRTWRKVHIGVNEQTHEIEAIELTDLGLQDCEGLPKLLDQIRGPIKQVIGDGAYDRFSCYQQGTNREFDLLVPPQKNSRTSWERPENKKKACMKSVLARDKAIEDIRKLGRSDWKKQTGYHRRSLAETAMMRIKQLMGKRLTSRTFKNQKVEIEIWRKVLNDYTRLGMPDSHPIAV